MASRGTVEAVNGLTARWVATLPEDGTVLAAAGVWPLLGLLADGAAGPARQELSAALGIPADGAATGARDVLSTLGAMPGLSAALGLWTRDTLPIEPAWRGRLGAGPSRRRGHGSRPPHRTSGDRHPWNRRPPVPRDT